MAFLDNSGDIILDAVLTDTGRMRLAKGDGSFRIAKFALGDEEINYASYNKDHASGSAYYDLQILQTPILEAFTNNTSTMKTTLMSIPRTTILYLPEIALNTLPVGNEMHPTTPNQNIFLVAVDSTTEDSLARVEGGAAGAQGVINGFTLARPRNHIRLDQGINSRELAPTTRVPGDLFETQYIIEMDDRFGSIWSAGDSSRSARVSFVDDDKIASYYLSHTTDSPTFVENLEVPATLETDFDQVILGPKGSKLKFTIKASLDLTSHNYLFDQLGSTGLSINGSDAGVTYRYLDSVVRVTGGTTGYRVDVPLRFVKKE
ncbi:hypothetical protein CMI37_16880 [Candidatus Pacearchaeota archaeon]|nr:hypothetical protein [Candidatus Pacearchaeota archaeon]